jgi:hypothetical protein
MTLLNGIIVVVVVAVALLLLLTLKPYQSLRRASKYGLNDISIVRHEVNQAPNVTDRCEVICIHYRGKEKDRRVVNFHDHTTSKVVRDYKTEFWPHMARLTRVYDVILQGYVDFEDSGTKQRTLQLPALRDGEVTQLKNHPTFSEMVMNWRKRNYYVDITPLYSGHKAVFIYALNSSFKEIMMET